MLFIISAVASPYFLQVQNLLNILRQVSYPGIVALGMTFVLIGGGIDLSVGSMMALVGALSISVLNATGGRELHRAHRRGGAGARGRLRLRERASAVTKGQIAPFIVTLGTFAVFRSLTLYYGDAGEFRSTSERTARWG